MPEIRRARDDAVPVSFAIHLTYRPMAAWSIDGEMTVQKYCVGFKPL
ncbi:TPA: hypothetical protein QDB02_003954 [Burkholderia vietnamiensis]|nr:hypothetical protein [Burkholderia vietnamiensis]